MMTFSKSQQTRGKKEKPITKAKYRDKVRSILDKAWKVQSEGVRKLGYCVGCGSGKALNAGHMIHGGRGKHHTRFIDFNVSLPHDNIYCQCSYCNCGNNPDGNGSLVKYFLAQNKTLDDYDELRLIKNIKMEVKTIEEAEWILAETIKRYG